MPNNMKNVTSPGRKPVVLMSMGAQVRQGQDYQVMTRKYMSPLVEIADCVPLLAPVCFGTANLDQYLSMVDGVYLTGASTNIDPALYGQENLTPEKSQDPDRDHFDLALIHAALERGLPIFCICRGMQELNVAFGGSLHQKLYAVPGLNDHREDSEAPPEKQYAESHMVRVVPDTWFADLMQFEEFPVNSLHGQGIDALGKGLEVLAYAEDGVIEAVHVPKHSQFSLAVQWHPEWRASENPYSVRLFKAFGNACRKQAARRKDG